MEDRALDYALESEGGLGVDVVIAGDGRCVFADEVGEVLAQGIDLRTAGAQGLGSRGIVEQREKQVLHGDEFVALLASLDKSHVQADFEFLGDHQFSSMTQASGCWFWRANALTCSTLVAAMSRG